VLDGAYVPVQTETPKPEGTNVVVLNGRKGHEELRKRSE
jgi:hypothetical protein